MEDFVDTNAGVIDRLLNSKPTELGTESGNNNATDTSEEKLWQLLKQIEKLESIVQMEQQLRRQADLRNKELLNTVEKIKKLSEQETNKKERAEAKAKQAVNRAIEMMNYFFNAPLIEGNISHNLESNNFTGFDSIMLNHKA